MGKLLPIYARAYWFIAPLAPLILYVGTLVTWLRFGPLAAMLWMLIGTTGTVAWLKPLINHINTKLPETQRLAVVIVGFVILYALVVPLLWIVITPDVPMIIGALLSITFVGTVEQFWALHLAHYGKLIRGTAIGFTISVSAAVTFGIMSLMLAPLCYWVVYTESPAMRFLNQDTMYGFTLCYNGGPDYGSLVSAVCVIYFTFALVMGCFMLIGNCFLLVYRGLRFIFGRT